MFKDFLNMLKRRRNVHIQRSSLSEEKLYAFVNEEEEGGKKSSIQGI